MYEVTQDYLDKATAAGRVYSLRVDVGELIDGEYWDKAQYFGGDGVLSLKIVRGQTTGGFSLGGTVCAQLSATFTNDVDVRVKDRLQVYVRFGSEGDVTDWHGLGWFYVDSVKQGLYSKSVIAYDAMLRFEKNYKSKLTYPANTNDVLEEISYQTNINVSSRLSLVNNAIIKTAPQMDKSKDGEQRYYTRRAMLGYIAATNAGEAYIDVDFKINIAMPTETEYTIEAASVISQTIDDTDFIIDGVVWNKSGISYSLNDDFTENTVELINPLEYASEEQVLLNLKSKLVGLSYSSITLKKQGTGIFQLGDLVNYVALDGTTYIMLVMGIVYDFSNGFFSETLYSLAKSASQQEYTGSQVTDQKEYTSSEPVKGVAEKLQTSDSSHYAVTKSTGIYDNKVEGLFLSNGKTEVQIFDDSTDTSSGWRIQNKAANGFRVQTSYSDKTKMFDVQGGNMILRMQDGALTIEMKYTKSTGGVDYRSIHLKNGQFDVHLGESTYLKLTDSEASIYVNGVGSLKLNSNGFTVNNGYLQLNSNGLYINGKKVLTE